MLPDASHSPPPPPASAGPRKWKREKGTGERNPRSREHADGEWPPGHNYIGHNYIGHNYIGHNYIGRRRMAAGRRRVGGGPARAGLEGPPRHLFASPPRTSARAGVPGLGAPFFGVWGQVSSHAGGENLPIGGRSEIFEQPKRDRARATTPRRRACPARRERRAAAGPSTGARRTTCGWTCRRTRRRRDGRRRSARRCGRSSAEVRVRTGRPRSRGTPGYCRRRSLARTARPRGGHPLPPIKQRTIHLASGSHVGLSVFQGLLCVIYDN